MKTLTSNLILLLLITLLVVQNTYSNNKKAPPFELKDLSGKTVKLSDFVGKVILIDFWATWCGPCKKGIPEFIELQKKYSKRGFVVIGIALDDFESVKTFYQSYKMNYPVLMGTNEVAKLYGGIRGIPTAFIVGKDGMIKQRYEGYRPKAVFEKDIIAELMK